MSNLSPEATALVAALESVGPRMLQLVIVEDESAGTVEGPRLEFDFDERGAFSELIPAVETFLRPLVDLEARDVGRWLVHRAQACGSIRAVEEAEQALRAGAVTVDVVALLAGPTRAIALEIPGDIRFVALEELPPSPQKEAYLRKVRSGRWTLAEHVTRPRAALVRTVRVPIENYRGFPWRYVDELDLYDFARCLETMLPHRASVVASWQRSRSEFPVFHDPQWSHETDEIPVENGWVLKGATAAPAIRLFKALLVAPAELRVQLRLVMKRIARARALSDTANQAVELGIALESLFITDDSQSELRFRLSQNGAWLLEPSELQAREAVANSLSLAYVVRCDAVHTGRLKRAQWGPNKVRTHEVIQNGIELCVRALLLIAEAGSFPDWTRLRLGGPGWPAAST